MKKYSKRLLCSCISAIWLIGTYSLAGTTGMSITLAPGWNVVSTPAILSSLSFSNGGNGISFSKLVNEKRQTVSATTENIKPLEWFMVNNSNTSAVTLTMQYKAGVSVTESLLKSDLNQGRNLLGITTTDHPFAHLTGASMSVDFTNGTSQGVSSNFTINTTSKEVSNPQLWKAYGIFVNTQNAIYGGVNNGGIAIDGTSTWGTTSGGNTSTWTGTTGNNLIDLTITYHPHKNKQLLKGETRNIWYLTFSYDDSYWNFSDVDVKSITLENKWSINHNEITSIYLENENKERISDIQSFSMDKKVTLTINPNYSHMIWKIYIVITVTETATIWHTIQLSTESVVWNIDLTKDEKLNNLYTIVDSINCNDGGSLTMACLMGDEDCPEVCKQRNSGENWSGTTVTSGTNEGVIFQNKLKDVVLYSGEAGAYTKKIWYDEKNQDIYFCEDDSCDTKYGMMIGSWIIQVDTEKKISFSITWTLQNYNPYSMELRIWQNKYTSTQARVISGLYYSWVMERSFDDVTIYPNAPFVLYGWWYGASAYYYNTDFMANNINLNLRNFIVKNLDLFSIDSWNLDKITINQWEKTSRVVYSWHIMVTRDITIDKLQWNFHLFNYGYPQNNYNYDNMVHNELFLHVYIDENEIWNSDYDTRNISNDIIIWSWMSSYTLQSWVHNIKIVEDFLYPDISLYLNNSISSVTNLSLQGTTNNWVSHFIQLWNWISVDIKTSNINNLILDKVDSYEKCTIDEYSYNSCDIDSDGNKKLIVFSWTYSAKDKPIIVTWFVLNHLTWNNFNNIHLNFELYINWNKVKEFGMSEINKILDVDDFYITTTPTEIKLLAIPTKPSSKFEGAMTFYWSYEDNSWTPRHDNVSTRNDVYGIDMFNRPIFETEEKNGNLTLAFKDVWKNKDIPEKGIVTIDSINLRSVGEVELRSIWLKLLNIDYTWAISVWLEDENGDKIASEKKFNSSSQVVLNLYKNFTVTSSKTINLVVFLKDALEEDSKIAFQIVNVNSSAETNTIKDWKDTSATGTIVSYEVAKVNFNMVNSGIVDYTIWSQTGYEIARFTIENPTKKKPVILKMVSLTNSGNADITILDTMQIVSNGEKVSSQWNIDNSKHQIVFTLNDKINTWVTKEYIVYANLDNIDSNWENYQFYLRRESDLSVEEEKSGFRANVELWDIYGSVYRFKEN